MNSISAIALLVNDYDEAVDWYVNNLGFTVLQDHEMGTDVRFIQIAPDAASSFSLVVTKARSESQIERVGSQAGDGVLGFLQTPDFWADHARMLEAGVMFLEKPREEVYATVAIFQDLYGNKWDLLQPTGQ